MIKSPRVIELYLQRCEQLLHFCAPDPRCRPGAGLVHSISFSWKSAEIVNRPWRGGGGQDSLLGAKPMCGDRQNGFGPGCCTTRVIPCFRIDIALNSIHRIAVTKKDSGEYLAHVDAPLFGGGRGVPGIMWAADQLETDNQDAMR